MKMIKPKAMVKILFLAWTALWLVFLVRGLVKGEAKDYKNLLGKTLDEKRACVTGEEFYDFIRFCKKIIPENSTYSVEANYDHSMDYFRFPYYTYPLLRNLYSPEYIVCYKVRFVREGYHPIARLADDKYILKKEK